MRLNTEGRIRPDLGSSCPLCSGSLTPIFATRDHLRPHDETLYEVGWCSPCSYGGVLGPQSPDQVRSFYQVPYYTHRSAIEAQTRYSLFERVRSHLAWRRDRGTELSASEGTGGTLLDIGCGSGSNMAMFAKAGMIVTGVEPDYKAREVASNIGPVFDGTAEAIPQELFGKTFDTVLFSHVLEHCIDPAVALLNARRLIAPAGRLIVEVPNNAAVGFTIFKHLWPWTDVPRHLHFFTEPSLHKLLRSAGFNPTKVHYAGYLRQFHPEWIRTQQQIWQSMKAGRAPRFGMAAWKLLAQTWRASEEQKYDSIRVHAEPVCS
jgi:SAM-dependent methyltransferase